MYFEGLTKLKSPVFNTEVTMSAEVIQFPSERHTSNQSGFSASEVNDALACSYPLIAHGIAVDVEPAHLSNGAVFVSITCDDGIGWLAFKDRGMFFLIARDDLTLVCSRDFNDLLEGLKAIAS